MPVPLKALAKEQRRDHIVNWIHCLVDALYYLHNQGRSHGNIRPSTVLFTAQHHIFYADLSRLGTDSLANPSDKAAFDKEAYDFAAPEQWFRPRKHAMRSPPLNPPYDYVVSPDASAAVPVPMLHAPTPHPNPQTADIFSLGCVILELLGFFMKRTTRSFASHRAARNKMAGRGGATPDASFHKNLGQLDSWIAGLAKDARKKDGSSGVTPLLAVAARMTSAAPHDRPTAQEVEQMTYKILREDYKIAEPHCVHQYGGWDIAMGHLGVNDEVDRAVIAGPRQSTSNAPPWPLSSDDRGRHSLALSGLKAIQNIRTDRSSGSN